MGGETSKNSEAEKNNGEATGSKLGLPTPKKDPDQEKELDHADPKPTEHDHEVEEQFVFIKSVAVSQADSGSISEFSTKKFSDPDNAKRELIENLMKSDNQQTAGHCNSQVFLKIQQEN